MKNAHIDSLEAENAILRRKHKKIFDAIAEFRKREKAEQEFAERRDTLSHDSILSHGKQLAYQEAAEYLEEILKK